MHKNFFTGVVLVLLSVAFLTACSHSSGSSNQTPCTPTPVAADSVALLAFARTNNMTVAKDTTGVYYQIIQQGTGAPIADTSIVFASYTGKLMTGYIFQSDTSAAVGFPLPNLIKGWKIGLPKINSGGHIQLLIPSALGYGCEGSLPLIPGSAPLFFDIQVDSVH